MESKNPDEYHLVYLSDTIKYYAEQLFPGYKVRNSAIFRITRNSDLYIDEEETENLLQTIENELHNRRKGAAVRLEIEDCVSDSALKTLVDALDIDESFIYRIPASPLNLARLSVAYDMVDRPDLKFPPYRPSIPAEFKNCDDYFSVIRKKDRLLHHPYESFSPVEEFISKAARDPDVLAIKLTLYRTSQGSPIVKALKEAATNGKQVTVLVELKARFDEENNIQWARELEERGSARRVRNRRLQDALQDVPYSSAGRRAARCADTSIWALATTIRKPQKSTPTFRFSAQGRTSRRRSQTFSTRLQGKVSEPKFDKLMVAPFCFHSKFLDLVRRETENAKAGKKARIIIKVNSVVEQSSIDALTRRPARA